MTALIPTPLPDAEALYAAMVARLADLPLDYLVGVERGGAWLAERAAATLKLPCASLDVSFYRDDYALRGLSIQDAQENQATPDKPATRLPTLSSLSPHLEGKRLALIDDVLGAGRTVRAALNALFEYGRLEKVWLFTLADRGGRALPIAADWAGASLELPPERNLQLRLSPQNRFYFVLL